MKNTFLIFLSLLIFTTASATISTKKQDILKLIGTSYAPNGKFAWIELNGVDYGWTREGGNVGKYRIVMVKMGKLKLDLYGKVMEFEMDYYERQEKQKSCSICNLNLDVYCVKDSFLNFESLFNQISMEKRKCQKTF